MVTSERKQKIKSLSRPLRDLVENERRKVEGEDSQRYLEDDSKRAVEDGLLLVRLPVGLGPPHEVGDPPVPRESDVLVPHHGKVARLRGIKTTGHPSHLGVPVLCELLAGGEGPQALLAGDDDAGVRGDALSHTSHEPRVELHVPVAEPPAAHAKGRHLLQQAARAHIIVGYEEGDLHSALDLALGDLLGRPNVQQDPAVVSSDPTSAAFTALIFPCATWASSLFIWSAISLAASSVAALVATPAALLPAVLEGTKTGLPG
eukprot:CAMPEP_0196644232 /NCGR_PEP_ID=MMETSP1085-20130531/6910_1 /TAXON_ID=41879 ORGANISM="Pycnococcus sp, Strain CCMP1998" /NCGR_SAMPLE_ID=MMETSP1085 /ASSEMBLY_ACC=CAM_ASM_000807 /LENGTH=260 /DNA_ID=CAMNT_0041973773 /DNA_START=26 /DNA_END=809 /DNA_ORIENTATION=-